MSVEHRRTIVIGLDALDHRLVERWSLAGELPCLKELLDTWGARAIAVSALLFVGLVAGLSSGFLGIGGGLAMVAGLSACLKMPQHRAQMTGLIMTLMPTTVCAAYVYWRAGQLPSWPILLAVIVGLWSGTDLGARMANSLERTTLRRVLVVMVTAMVLYMGWRALTPPSGR